METNYENLLKKAYKEVRLIEKSSERFEIPKTEGFISGKNTIITNILQIALYLRRPLEQIVKFLQKELATSGRMEKEHLVLNTKLNSAKVNEKIEFYAKNFVICNECGKPDTENVLEKGIKFKHCLACGAKSPIRYNL